MWRFFLLLFISFASLLPASSINKAFKALYIYDYFKAKKFFYKSLKKNTTAAAYGLATIYLRNDNPFHNYDSAYKYCMLSRFSFAALSDKNRNTLKNYRINDSTIGALCDSVFIKAHASYLAKADRSAQPDSLLNNYIGYYFFSSGREDAIRRRDNIVFSAAKKKYSSSAFRQYILTWPESHNIEDAFYFLEKTLYEENTQQKKLEDYHAFILNFPKNRFVKNAQEEIFLIHRKNRDKEGMKAFIRTFPQNEHINEAWKLLFTLSVDRYTSENLAEFVLDYPDFPLKNTIIDEINLLNKQLLRVKSGDKFGFIDTAGKIEIPPSLEDVEEFSEGLAVAAESDKYGYIDKKGNWAIKALYDEAEDFHDGVATVKHNKKHLLIDRTGLVITDEFEEIGSFSEGLAVVKKNGKYGAINRLGKLIIPAEYEKLGEFRNGHAWFERDGKYGILDKQNFISIHNQYEWLDNYGDFIRAKKNGLYGVINKNGEEIIPFTYDRIDNYINEVFVLIKGGKYGFGDKTGCLHTWIEYDFDNSFKRTDLTWKEENSGKLLFKLVQDESYALMNENGKLLIDYDEYEEVYLPGDALVRVMNRDKYSFLDLKMHPAFKGSYDEAEDFRNGFAVVTKKDKPFIIDKSGNTVFNEECEDIERLENNCFLITRSGLMGLLNDKLQWIVQPEFQEIEPAGPGYFELKKDGKSMLYSLLQNKIIFTDER